MYQIEVLIATLLTIIYLLYIYYHKAFRYWKKKGIETIKPSIPFGNFGTHFFGEGTFISIVVNSYEYFKAKGVKFGGLYAGTRPLLLLVHPEVIKNVLTKDFQYFNSHGFPFDEKEEPLQAHLFNLDGKKWKDMRVKLTPTFTSGKMKMMFKTLLECGEQLEKFLDSCHQQKKPLEIKEIMSRYTTDVIGSCAFGLECNSFKNPNAQFRNYGRKLLRPGFKSQLKRFAHMLSPAALNFFKLHLTDKEITKFFMGVVKDTIDYRQSNKITRNDFMQILINMEEQAKLEGKETFTLEQISAQAFIFYLAGFETSSATMTFCLYELAYHQDIQDQLREEINRTLKKYDGNLTYNGISEMKYLDQVVNETLRKYPPIDIIPRVCTQNYLLPNGTEVSKGTKVLISALSLQRDRDYFPQPEKFNPDRFSDENKQAIVPYTFLPFGEGPRICIGLRFGVMQTKVGISLLLKNYKIFPHESLQYPLKFDNQSIILSPKGTILLTTQII